MGYTTIQVKLKGPVDGETAGPTLTIRASCYGHGAYPAIPLSATAGRERDCAAAELAEVLVNFTRIFHYNLYF